MARRKLRRPGGPAGADPGEHPRASPPLRRSAAPPLPRSPAPPGDRRRATGAPARPRTPPEERPPPPVLWRRGPPPSRRCGRVRRGAAGIHDERREHDGAVSASGQTRRRRRAKGRCRETPPAGSASPRSRVSPLAGRAPGETIPGYDRETERHEDTPRDRAALATATVDNRAAAVPRETSPRRWTHRSRPRRSPGPRGSGPGPRESRESRTARPGRTVGRPARTRRACGARGARGGLSAWSIDDQEGPSWLAARARPHRATSRRHRRARTGVPGQPRGREPPRGGTASPRGTRA